MNMRPKTKRRLVILVVGAMVLIGAFASLYAFRRHQIEAKTMAARAAGLEAFKQGDYNAALKELSYYNERRQRDAETLLAFAKARSRVETPNYRHLVEAASFYRRGLELQPDNTDAKHALLEIYANPYVSYNAEAVALADQLIAKDAKDVTAIRAKATVLYRLRRLDEALAASEKLNELAPLDVEGQRLTYELLFQLKRPGDEILSRAAAAYKEHPDDPRFAMLQGYAFMLTDQNEKARELLLTAAKGKAPDAGFVRELCGMLDAMRMYDESNALLERSAADGADPEMRRMLIQRLWQGGRFAEVADRLKDLNDRTGDAKLLAFRALSLYQTGKSADAKGIVDALSKRKDDDISLAWAKALRARFESPNLTPGQQIAEYQSALGRDPYNPVIRYMLGDAYARLEETEPALQAWRAVAESVPSWATPRIQIARMLAETGRPEAAVDHARIAYARAQNIGSAISLAVAWANYAGRDQDDQRVQDVLKLVSDIQAKVPYEPETLPIYAALLGRTGQTAEAEKVIRGALASDQVRSEETLLKLAGVSRLLKLNVENALFDKSEKLNGPTPTLAFARAVSTAGAGTPEANKAALDKLREQAAAAKERQPEWQLAVARFMQSTGDPAAREAWTKLGEAYPNDLPVQAAIADLPETSAVWQDRAFVDKTIQRLRSITGDEGHRWQLARARWLLGSENVSRDSADAVVILTDLVRSSPGVVAPRVYLARALENVKQVDQAIDQLKDASQMAPNSPVIGLELARLLQQTGRTSEAAQYLDRVARAGNLDPEQRLRAAALFAKGGDDDDALRMLQSQAGAGMDATSRDRLLAAVHRRKGEFNEADAIYRRLLRDAKADANVVLEAADFYASRRDVATARQLLARLDQSNLDAEKRAAALADFEERFGDQDAAAKLLRDATAANPASAGAWAQLSGYQLRHGDIPGAVATADAGLRATAGASDVLLALKSNASRLQALGDRPELRPLADAASRMPTDPAVADTIADLTESTRAKESGEQFANRLQMLADRHARFMPVQKLAIGALLRIKHYDDAARLAARCISTFPNDPDACELAVVAHASAGKWSDMLAAAEEWRSRTPADPVRPDLAIAEARMQMGQTARAIQQLDRYAEAAKKDPAANEPVVAAYTRALVMDGREKDAAAILSPLLKSDARWRNLWLRLASSVRGSDSAARWIEQVAAAVPATNAEERQFLAGAWYGVGVRYGDNRGYTAARDVLTPIAGSPSAKASTFVLLAAVCEKLSDRDGAIDAYRKALRLEPNLPLAQNNLAYQLLLSNQRLDEARELAQRAVAAASDDPSYQDTLGRILSKVGDHAAAARTYQTLVQLQPNNVEAQLGLAKSLIGAGNRDQASSVLSQIESLLRTDSSAAAVVASGEPRQDLESVRQALTK